MHYFGIGKMIAMVFTLIYFIFFFNPIDYESGLDVFSSRNFNELKDKQVGVIVNHTSLSSNGKHLVELIHSNNINVVAHIGVTPQKFINFNKIKSVGRTIKEIQSLILLAKNLEDEYNQYVDAHIYICRNLKSVHPFGIHFLKSNF